MALNVKLAKKISLPLFIWEQNEGNQVLILDNHAAGKYLNTSELFYFTPHPPLPLKGGGLERG
jgi:hypothetical protein